MQRKPAMSSDVFRRLSAAALPLVTLVATAVASPPHWPSFRGPQATGVADGTSPPTSWDIEKDVNIRWKRPIPGLAHSSPIVWGDRAFVTTAVSGDVEPYLRTGLYGESPDHPEDLEHDFRVYCIDRNSGKIHWKVSAHRGVPRVKRHVKSSHSNSTPATDGKHVVAFFGSEGLYCYDFNGRLLWKQDLGLLDSGAPDLPEIQWGFASSPIIHKDTVYVQCDVNNQSFVAALDVNDGKEKWRALRDTTAGWGTPTIHEGNARTQVIANGYQYMAGYDAASGRELWRLTGGGDIPVPTPYVAGGLIYITNGHGAWRPIFAIRRDATGDISLDGDKTSNDFIVWCRRKHGSYIPTTIVYRDYLYVADDRGILSCYEARTGEKVYRERLAESFESHSASPVAADGKLYVTSEDGTVRVVKAGPTLEVLATNQMREPCLATPAISDRMILIRTAKQLVAIGAP